MPDGTSPMLPGDGDLKLQPVRMKMQETIPHTQLKSLHVPGPPQILGAEVKALKAQWGCKEISYNTLKCQRKWQQNWEMCTKQRR